MRNSVNKLESRLKLISNQLGVRLAMNVQTQMPGTRVRVTTEDERRDISPRLSLMEMDIWMNGFQMCLNEIHSK